MNDVAYLDYAATSAVRPRAVIQAVSSYLADIGATPGRSGHRLAAEAGRTALRCRQTLARLLNIPGDPGRIAFMPNATHALNTAIHGVIRPGDRIVVTAFDHNSVLRPAAALPDASVILISGDASGALDEHALARALDGARLFCINAASNVLGTVLDVGRLAGLARDAGALALVDAAQNAGHIPFDVEASRADMVAFTGHKGLLGPPGIGALWVREGVDVVPLITGGTGGNSLEREMPSAWPDHLEAGSGNGPALAGLEAGVRALLEDGVQALHSRTSALKRTLHEELSHIEGVRVVSPLAPDGAPIVTMVAEGLEPAALAARLDREYGILTRPGLHCAPEVHRILGTDRTGALRFSLGWASTGEHVARAVAGVRAVLAGATPRRSLATS